MKSGSFKQKFEGTARDDEIHLTFSGTSTAGTNVEGTATLRRRETVGRKDKVGVRGTIAEQLALKNKLRKAAKKRAEEREASIRAEAKELTKRKLEKAVTENQLKTVEDELRFWIYRERLAGIREEQITPERRKAMQEFTLQLFGALVSESATAPKDVHTEAYEEQRRLRLSNEAIRN